MRTLTNMSVMLLLVIASGLPAAPVLAGHSNDLVVVAADQDDDWVDDDDGDDDNSRGRGNDDGDEDNNRGRGNDDVDKPNSWEVSATEGYRVETECDVDDDDDTTECEFSGIAPSNASDIDRITVPADGVCTEVIDGDFVFVDAASGAGVTGYMSKDDDDELELELVGRVTTTGTIVVAAYSCAPVPDDTSAFDWFAECVPGFDPLGFRLTPSGENAADQRTAETMFEMLDPGAYQLEVIDALWCHAKSDRVTGESEVVVQAAEQTTVWTFFCDAGRE